MRIILLLLILITTTITADAKTRHKHDRQTPPAQAELCMAQAIYHEAKSESQTGKIAVGKVIMNRVNAVGYADNVCGVVYERCQFAFTCRKTRNIDWQQNAELIELSKRIIAGEFPDYSQGAISFNNKPFRNRGLIKTAKIGNHYFYKNSRTSKEV